MTTIDRYDLREMGPGSWELYDRATDHRMRIGERALRTIAEAYEDEHGDAYRLSQRIRALLDGPGEEIADLRRQCEALTAEVHRLRECIRAMGRAEA